MSGQAARSQAVRMASFLVSPSPATTCRRARSAAQRRSCSSVAPRRAVDYEVYLVTDRKLSRGRPVEEVVETAITGGVSVVQLRDKDVSTEEMIQLGRKLVAITRRRGLPLLVNDRVDVALEIGADGVHVGQDDMEARAVRSTIGPEAILGVSAGTVEEARAAEAAGADYLGVGAVFGTASKADAGEAIGTAALREIAEAVSIPVVAIGGIGVHNVQSCVDAGVDGVAVISAIMSAEDPATAASLLKRPFFHRRVNLDRGLPQWYKS